MQAFIDKCNQNPEVLIDGFFGEYRFLSNFEVAPVVYEGMSYPSSENAYQAAKLKCLEDRIPFTKCTPAQSKKLGRAITLREDWEEIKLKVMEDILIDKFNSNVDLKLKLLATDNAVLIEGNWWLDKFWGMHFGVGENNLGKLLMKIRGDLRKVGA